MSFCAFSVNIIFSFWYYSDR